MVWVFGFGHTWTLDVLMFWGYALQKVGQNQQGRTFKVLVGLLRKQF